MMKVKDIRAMDEAAKQKELLELRKEQFNLHMQRATGQLAKPSRMKEVRRDIARIKTVMNETKGKTA